MQIPFLTKDLKKLYQIKSWFTESNIEDEGIDNQIKNIENEITLFHNSLLYFENIFEHQFNIKLEGPEMYYNIDTFKSFLEKTSPSEFEEEEDYLNRIISIFNRLDIIQEQSKDMTDKIKDLLPNLDIPTMKHTSDMLKKGKISIEDFVDFNKDNFDKIKSFIEEKIN